MRKKVSTYKELFSKEVCYVLNMVCERDKGFIIEAFKIKEVADYIHWEFVLKTTSKKQTLVFSMTVERKYCEKALEELKSGYYCLVFEDEERALEIFFKEEPKEYYISYDILPRYLSKEVIETIKEIGLNNQWGDIKKIEMHSKEPTFFRLNLVYKIDSVIIVFKDISALKEDFETLRIYYYDEF